jgi:signal transduction histidine kinase/CheY-like chemotaxis protein
MLRFQDQPISRKAIILGLVPAICALAIASLAYLASTYLSIRNNTIADINASAMMIADSVDVALGFQDTTTANALARALREKPNIDRGCIFDAEGRYFGGYVQHGPPCPASLTAVPALQRSQVLAVQTVTAGNKPIGTVRIIGNLDQVTAALAAQGVLSVLVLIASIGVALLLIRRLQRAIADPVVELARTADQVSRTGDYRLRARQTTGDEVGQLVQSFNAMLDAIQHAEQERIGLLQREREASRLKDEFLAAVSHELRTPLNAIVGWTHILTTTKPSAETLDRGLKTVQRNAQAQTRLIEDLIEVSRIATGKLVLELEAVDLRDVVQQGIEAVHANAATKGLTVEVSVPAAPAFVSGDRDRLQQVVGNLLNNAMKFTPEGGSVMVSLSAAGRADFVLRVRDTGIGIAPEFLPHVFERFRQGDGSTTREHGGLGLGLAIVHDLVQLHKGTVTASSAGRNMGAEFVVRLPQLVDAAPTRPDAAPPTRGVQLVGLRVLAVDDNADALELVAAALADAGALVDVRSSGAEALQRWRADPGDVLVCDIAMPDMDGFEVIRRVRELDGAAGRRAFAIALTAYATTDFARRARDAGFDAHVAKPLDPRRLIELIAERRAPWAAN